MERARLLLEMVKRREKLKRDELQLFPHVIELRLEELKHNLQNGVGEGAENDLTPPTKRKKSIAPAEYVLAIVRASVCMWPYLVLHRLKRKRPVYEEPSSDFDDEEEEDEEEDDEEAEEVAAGATSDAEYSPSEDEAEAPPSPRALLTSSTSSVAPYGQQAMEVTTQQSEGVRPRHARTCTRHHAHMHTHMRSVSICTYSMLSSHRTQIVIRLVFSKVEESARFEYPAWLPSGGEHVLVVVVVLYSIADHSGHRMTKTVVV